MLAGGGGEGAPGDRNAWSARLYSHLLDAGDITGDGRVCVALVARREQTEWLPQYLEWLGADDAINLMVDSTAAADDPSLDALFANVDAVFIKGGDQGKYYDLWNDRRIECLIREVVERGGGIGGTSAGAMSLCQYALTGGRSPTSTDALTDAYTPELDDEDGGSGIHADFLDFLPGALVDTHVTERARLGRTIGAMAKALQEQRLTDILGIAIDSRTGVWIRGGRATVVGVGGVSFVRPTSQSHLRRARGRPLIWTNLRLDQLTDGWTYDLVQREPETRQPPAVSAHASNRHWTDSGKWRGRGDESATTVRIERVVSPTTGECEEQVAGGEPQLLNCISALDAYAEKTRAIVHEGLYRALHDHIGATGLLIAKNSAIWRTAEEPSILCFGPADERMGGAETATLVFVTDGVTWTSLSPNPSSHDIRRTLHAAGLVNLTLHVLADTAGSGLAFDNQRRRVVQMKPP